MIGDPNILRGFFCLLWDANMGLSDTERSSWIIDQGGVRSLLRWPFTGELSKATWSGPLPAGLVGQAHTHPDSRSAKPSGGDRIVARNHGIPVYSVSREAVWKNTGAAANDVQVASGRWWKGFKKKDC